MNDRFEKSSGIALIISSLAMVATMVMHPAGGSIEHLLKSTPVIVGAHAIAIFSVPISAVGFWGLTRRLGSGTFISFSAFVIMITGLFAIMCAAAINGLVLPLFLNKFQTASSETLESIRPILQYNGSLNHAFDFIYIAFSMVAVLLWSIMILKLKTFPAWTGYLGILLCVSAGIVAIRGFNLVDLMGFRLFIFGLVIWTFAIGIFLSSSKVTEGVKPTT